MFNDWRHYVESWLYILLLLCDIMRCTLTLSLSFPILYVCVCCCCVLHIKASSKGCLCWCKKVRHSIVSCGMGFHHHNWHVLVVEWCCVMMCVPHSLTHCNIPHPILGMYSHNCQPWYGCVVHVGGWGWGFPLATVFFYHMTRDIMSASENRKNYMLRTPVRCILAALLFS